MPLPLSYGRNRGLTARVKYRVHYNYLHEQNNQNPWMVFEMQGTKSIFIESFASEKRANAFIEQQNKPK